MVFDEIYADLVAEGAAGLTASQTREIAGVTHTVTYDACPTGDLSDPQEWVAVAGEGVTHKQVQLVGGKEKPKDANTRSARQVTGRNAVRFAEAINGVVGREKKKKGRGAGADTLPSENGHASSGAN